jgi:hypothetical protein
MWWLIALLAADGPAVAFDLGKTAPAAGPDEIIVTARRDENLRYRLDPTIEKDAADKRLSVDLGFGKLTPDAEQGRLGDTRIVIRLTVPF